MSASGEQTRKPKPKENEEEEVSKDRKGTAETKSQEVDDLLDEIDEVLEENAEEFVRSYIQKGGQ
ncbi:MAG: ubiquitin-like protein Pup [Actinobacteria bacterium]|nr:ubiquitin-like protein Pup [Actinomycetota bacterium]